MAEKYTDQRITEYIDALQRAAGEWLNISRANPKLSAAYYWPLFTEIFKRNYENIDISISEAEKIIPNLSSSQARRALQLAHQEGFLEIKQARPGSRQKLVKPTDKTKQLIRRVCSKGLNGMEDIFSSSLPVAPD